MEQQETEQLDKGFYREVRKEIERPAEVLIGSLIFSADYTKVMPAMSKAIQAIQFAAKDSKNPHFNSKYADLASCMNAAKPALEENGLSLSQTPEVAMDMKSVTVSNLLIHDSGQYVRWNLTVPIEGVAKPHTVGSSITYCRRFSLPVLGIVADEDDDGNSGSGVGNQQQAAPRQQPRPPAPPPAAPAKAAPKAAAASPAAQPAAQATASQPNTNDVDAAIAKAATDKGTSTAAIAGFLNKCGITEQDPESQVEFLRLYTDESKYSKLAQHWKRSGKTFQECLDQCKDPGVGIDKWLETLKS